MSYCPNCGRQILDESLGCPVCNVKNNTDPSWTSFDGKAEVVFHFPFILQERQILIPKALKHCYPKALQSESIEF